MKREIHVSGPPKGFIGGERHRGPTDKIFRKRKIPLVVASDNRGTDGAQMPGRLPKTCLLSRSLQGATCGGRRNLRGSGETLRR